MSQGHDNAGSAPLDALGAGSLSFDRVASEYDRTRGYPPAISSAIAEGFMRHGPITPGARALEIGVGTGRIALPLLERGVNMTGVDISTQMTTVLRSRFEAERAAHPDSRWGDLDITLTDSVQLPFPATSFDAVVAVHVFHLITGWREALREALRVLRPGAPLLLGQDMHHGAHVSHPMQDEWIEIATTLGHEPRRLGAAHFTDILAEARALSLTIEEWTVAEWTTTYTAASAFSDIADKTWSLTWQVPEPMFTESVKQLELWAHARFGATWTQPVPVNCSFRLARINKPTI